MKIDSTMKPLKTLLLVTTLSLCGISAVVRHDLKTHQDRKPVLQKIASANASLDRNAHGSMHQPDAHARARVSEAYGKLPLRFEANQGQTDDPVNFVSRGSGYTLFLTPTEAVLSLTRPEPKAKSEGQAPKGDEEKRERTGAVLRMQLLGANSRAQVTGLDQLPGKVNYFIGDDPRKWHADIPTYARVKYEEVYPGVDLVYYGNEHQLEYDFVVTPGADTHAIELGFQDADKLEIDAEGNLIIAINGAQVVQHAPYIYQEIDGVRQTIVGRYEMRDQQRVGFELEAYDAGRTLLIDPMLVYSTYFGGSFTDRAWALAVDSQGFAYVTGQTGSSDFPKTTSAVFNGGYDVFVTKLSPDGRSLAYSTIFGGSDSELGLSIALDKDEATGQRGFLGLAYVTGYTHSSNFPTTQGAFDTTHNNVSWAVSDAFVTKLDVNGGLVYSTYLGGTDTDSGDGIDVDSQGVVYLGGLTWSTNFPTTLGAYDRTHNGKADGFIAKLDARGSALAYSTFLGGMDSDWVRDITVEAGLAYVTGETFSSNGPDTLGAFPTTIGAYDRTHNGASDVFVTELNALGSSLAYSTFIGGSGKDEGWAIVVGNGVVSITGSTQSSTFPTTRGAYSTSFNGGTTDGFVARLNAMGSSLIYSTFLGGGANDVATDIVIDTAGLTYVTGWTNSSNFPLMNQIPSPNHALYDVFVTKLNGQGTGLAFSTVLGGGNDDGGYGIGLNDNFTYVAGVSVSSDFPVTNGSYDTTHNGVSGGMDAIVVKLTTGP
jgi:hypothetical protein